MSQQITNLQTELNYLNKFKIYWIFSYTTLPHPLTHILTHPSTQPPIHPPIGGGVSTNHKSSNRIELSRLGPDLFDF